MLKKIRSLMYQYAIPAAFIVYLLIDIMLFGIGRLLSILPESLPMAYLSELILIIIPIAIVYFFGFSSAFKKGNFLRGLICFLPFIVFQIYALVNLLLNDLGSDGADWKPWYLVVYSIFSIIGIGIREECIYRATIQNIIAKKHANSVKGVWLTVILGAIIFGLTHSSNIFFGMEPLAVLYQMISTTFVGLMFGAVYLRSGSLWALISVHTLTDITGLARSTFTYIGDIEDMNRMSLSWGQPVKWLIYVGLAIFLLRPSKCKQISESLCFAGEESKADTNA